jgi:hypothetical protein
MTTPARYYPADKLTIRTIERTYAWAGDLTLSRWDSSFTGSPPLGIGLGIDPIPRLKPDGYSVRDSGINSASRDELEFRQDIGGRRINVQRTIHRRQCECCVKHH